MKKENKMHNELGKYYDKIYHFKNYEKESKVIINIIEEHKKPQGNNLLELGCGSGKHLKYLSRKYNCVGTDLNKGILNEAKKQYKNIKFKQMNMIDFSLNQQFDIIISLFSSIAYVKTKSNLKKTIKSISHHLKTGEITIIEGWFSKEEFRGGDIFLHTYEDDNLKIARTAYSRKKGSISELNFGFTIAEKSKGITQFIDKHELALFDHNFVTQEMIRNGFKILNIKNRNFRTLYVGIKK